METDFLVALVKNDDWLRDDAVDALDRHDDIHTSILSYAELLVVFYDDRVGEYEIDPPRVLSNLLELVPIVPRSHENAVLAATEFIDEHGLSPFDALHAGLATTRDERVLSTEQDYDEVGVPRIPLASDDSE